MGKNSENMGFDDKLYTRPKNQANTIQGNRFDKTII